MDTKYLDQLYRDLQDAENYLTGLEEDTMEWEDALQEINDIQNEIDTIEADC